MQAEVSAVYEIILKNCRIAIRDYCIKPVN